MDFSSGSNPPEETANSAMQLKPRTELKVLAIALLLLGILLLGTLFVTVPAYGNFRSMPWHQMFRTERLHVAFLRGYKVVFFGVLPALGIVNTAGGWLILKQFRGNSKPERP
jgi:hypothetical protein